MMKCALGVLSTVENLVPSHDIFSAGTPALIAGAPFIYLLPLPLKHPETATATVRPDHQHQG